MNSHMSVLLVSEQEQSVRNECSLMFTVHV